MKLQVPETTERDTMDKRWTTVLLLYKLEALEVGTMNHKGQRPTLVEMKREVEKSSCPLRTIQQGRSNCSFV